MGGQNPPKWINAIIKDLWEWVPPYVFCPIRMQQEVLTRC
jgi:hypothetical protein